MTTLVTSAILSADYFCLVSYISSSGHFSKVKIDCLVTALKSLLEVLYCRVTALDKKPKLSASTSVTKFEEDCSHRASSARKGSLSDLVGHQYDLNSINVCKSIDLQSYALSI